MKFYQWKEVEGEATKECPYHVAPCGYYPGRPGETERSKVVTVWLTDQSDSRKSTRNNEIQKGPEWGYLSDGSRLRQHYNTTSTEILVFGLRTEMRILNVMIL